MLNLHDPVETSQDSLLLTKLSHAFSGLYIWEYFTSLEYEWGVIRGHRPYRWTIWIYSLTRLAALITVLLNMAVLDYAGLINCQAVYSFGTFVTFLTMAASSLLIVLRVIAIWNRNKVIMAISISMWGINSVLLVQLVARLRAASASARLLCVSPNIESSAPNLTARLITDIGLLLIMLVGLFRLRRHGSGTLAQVLWEQGVIWLLITIVVEVPPTILMLLDSSGTLAAFNIMFMPTWTTMAIAATRMHRSLTDFVSASANVAQGDPVQNSSLTDQGTQRIKAGSIPMNGMEVVVHTVSEQHGTLRARDDDSYISTDEQMRGIPDGLNCDHENLGRAV